MSILKLTGRSIRSFFGRYVALFLIVALSVGFFAGLKMTKNAMVDTFEDYAAEQKLYDFRVYSTLGFTESDVEKLAELPGIANAEGTKSVDVMLEYGGQAAPFTLFSLTEKVNLPALTAGRLPEAAHEVLADDHVFHEVDIGAVLSMAEENDDTAKERLTTEQFTIVGLAKSPLYIGNDRGTTNIGSGSLHGFLYTMEDSFSGDVYTEVDLTLSETARIYSDRYDKLVSEYEETVSERCRELAEQRYDALLSQYGVSPETAAQTGIVEPEVYVLTRDENAGYVRFESDTSIVSGIANIFPLFFILIAMLVCVTTMTRMVDEERTQNGVLMALGFRGGAVMAKYLLYAGSATVLGWTVGFFFGTWGLPKLFWAAFSSLYDFASMKYLFSPLWAVGTLFVSLIGILGSTWFSCVKELREKPAVLIRPKAAKTGKRIFLEYITPVWKQLSFLQKITTRNMFRYKRRLIMMLLGIGCCAALVVTAFGVRDSMIGIGALQYGEIQKYDMEVAFETGSVSAVAERLDEMEDVDAILSCAIHRVEAKTANNTLAVNLYCFEDEPSVSEYWDFHIGDAKIPYPGYGEALISTRAAQMLGLTVGDSFQLENADLQRLTVKVSGIFDNYINGFAFVSKQTFENGFGSFGENTLLVKTSGDAVTLPEKVTDIPEVTSVTQLSDERKSTDDALACVNYIIWIVIAFAGALAFIVIFNLTNINLAERSREVATVEVLGFYPQETESYVLRENLILSVLASFIGLPLGTLFHRVVMNRIVIDSLAFDTHVTALSYVLSLIITVLFAVLVNLFMKRQIMKIPMAESLKAVE